jgi:uroporphyrinogen decarboxylase
MCADAINPPRSFWSTIARHQRVPFWELSFDCWDHFATESLTLGHAFEALSEAAKHDAVRRNAALFAEVCETIPFSAITAPADYWEEAPGQLAYYVLPGDWRFRQVEAMRAAVPADVMIVANASAILAADYDPDFCEMMFEEPEGIDAIVAARLAAELGHARRYIDAGAGAVVSCSDVADNNGPFFHPYQMERWIYPQLRQWARQIQEWGAFAILHSDGALDRYLEPLADSGIDALQAIDPVAGMDLTRTLDQVGDRICVCGNFDNGRLLLATPEEIYAAAREMLLGHKGRGRWALGCSNAVQPEVPRANYAALVAAWREASDLPRG